MSLTDKVVKNFYYFILGQIIGFVFPLILTPIIINKIGSTEYGIFAIVMGFVGSLGLFDLSVSNSFIKFISEHYNKKQFDELNGVINTGMLFYVVFSFLFFLIGAIFAAPLLSLLNIPSELNKLSIDVLRLSLLIFFVTTSFGIFNSILISLQKQYLTSFLGILLSLLNFTTIIIVLYSGYGLKGIVLSHLATYTGFVLMTYFLARRNLPEMKLGFKYFNRKALKSMTNFGIQMQVSKLSTYANDKYDEFLLGSFSVMSNVTFYNIAARIARVGKFFPLQVFSQVAPVAAELHAKNENDKLIGLLRDTTKYLTILSAPIFIFTIFFPEVMITAWLGNGYEVSYNILRILAFGQLINCLFSAPGNAIIPNTGLPKYQMHEGIINLVLNIPLSFLLIKFYGIIGAAYGNSIAIVLSSFYIYFTTIRHYKQQWFNFFRKNIIMPNLAAIIFAGILYAAYVFLNNSVYHVTDRYSALIYLIPAGLIFSVAYILIVLRSNYINERDKLVFGKILYKVLPLKRFSKFNTAE